MRASTVSSPLDTARANRFVFENTRLYFRPRKYSLNHRRQAYAVGLVEYVGRLGGRDCAEVARLDFAGIFGDDVCWDELLVQAEGGTVGANVARGIKRAFSHVSISSACAEIAVKQGA